VCEMTPPGGLALGEEVPLDSTDGVSSLSFAPLGPLLLATSWDGVRLPQLVLCRHRPGSRFSGASGVAWCRGCACTMWALTNAYGANIGKKARSSAALSSSPERCWQAGWTRISSGGWSVVSTPHPIVRDPLTSLWPHTRGWGGKTQ
jgi:hypothetical protein